MNAASMDAIEQTILRRIDEQRDLILGFARDIYDHPELSDAEFGTAERVAGAFSRLGLSVQTGLSGTGVRGGLPGAPDRRPRVALIGELDAIRCPGHPDADPRTGAAHACGHHVQLAAVYGAAIALSDPKVRSSLGGDAAFFAVPAEERNGGKCRMIAEGLFDGIDVAVTHHTNYLPGQRDLTLGSMRCNGVSLKRVTYRGRAAHAGGAPHEGINALAAASIGLTAIGHLRETFRDQDGVRAHGIITEGGAAQNVVPDRVVLEYGVRANNAFALADANEKVDRAFRAGALAMGAQVEIEELFAYAPMRYRAATGFQREIAALLLPPERVYEIQESDFHPASTDVGDLGEKMPVVNFTTGGFSGNLHSADYRMLDADTALLLPARVMALSAYRLLRDGAREAAALL